MISLPEHKKLLTDFHSLSQGSDFQRFCFNLLALWILFGVVPAVGHHIPNLFFETDLEASRCCRKLVLHHFFAKLFTLLAMNHFSLTFINSFKKFLLP